jgi:hypothetical protein
MKQVTFAEGDWTMYFMDRHTTDTTTHFEVVNNCCQFYGDGNVRALLMNCCILIKKSVVSARLYKTFQVI